MITNSFRLVVSDNLFQQNEVLQLNKDSYLCQLSGMAFLTEAKGERAGQAEALRCVVNMLAEHRPDYQPWLLIGHTSWQPDTRIVRHKKLFGYMKDGNRYLPKGRLLDEHMIVSGEGVKYFSAIQCEEFDPIQTLELLSQERACTLVFVKADGAENIIAKVISHGWSKQGVIPPLGLLQFTCSAQLLVCFHIGEFDDVEEGVGIVGPYDQMASMLD